MQEQDAGLSLLRVTLPWLACTAQHDTGVRKSEFCGTIVWEQMEESLRP